MREGRDAWSRNKKILSGRGSLICSLLGEEGEDPSTGPEAEGAGVRAEVGKQKSSHDRRTFLKRSGGPGWGGSWRGGAAPQQASPSPPRHEAFLRGTCHFEATLFESVPCHSKSKWLTGPRSPELSGLGLKTSRFPHRG